MELGAQSKWNADLEKATVQGARTAGELQRLVLGFARDFVLCPTCSNPETVFKLRKGELRTRCAACGDTKAIAAQAHRLTAQINNQIEREKKDKKSKKSKKEKKEKKDKKDKKSKKSKKSKAEDGEDDEDDEDDEDEDGGSSDGESVGGGAAAAAASGAGGSAAGADEDEGEEEEDDEEEEEEVVEGQEAAATAADVVEDDLSAVLTAAEALADDLTAALETPPAVVALLRTAQTRAMLRVGHRLAILYMAVMRGAASLEASASAVHRNAMVAVLDDAGPKHKLELQARLCTAVEHDLGTEHAAAARVAPVILRRLFDGHVLDEEGIQAWAETRAGASKAVRAACEPLLTWLDEAEQEVVAGPEA